LKKVLIVVGVMVVIAVFVVLNLTREGSRVAVRVETVEPRTIKKSITASGRIEPTRQVDVSATSIGKVTRLAVEEGDYVQKGDFLLEIDPMVYQSAVDELRASIRSAMATLEMERASLSKAEYDLERTQQLHGQNMMSENELRAARLNVDVAVAKAEHDLSEVRITADISGVITALNVEEGEAAIMGTLNNPGTVLLTVADLSEIECEVEVDETEVVFVTVGQAAEITVDAYPDSIFKGVVTEVGNSAIRSQVALGQSSVDFKVVVKVIDRIPNVRPGLSASTEIQVAEAESALSVPIQSLTVRRASQFGDGDSAPAQGDTDPEQDEDVEGVFVVDAGTARFRPVIVGIAGSQHFQVLDGLAEGEQVVSGPFQAINQLQDGDPVKIETELDDE
jgi:HlyD family secretion protein